MDWIETLLTLLLTLQGANTIFLWSLHEKVTELVTQRQSCAFCQSDVSSKELENIRRLAQKYDHAR